MPRTAKATTTPVKSAKHQTTKSATKGGKTAAAKKVSDTVVNDKVVAPAVVAPAVVAPAVVAPVSATPEDATSKAIVGIQEDFNAYLAKIQQAVSLLGTLRTEFRSLERRTTRELKAAEKITQKRKRKTGNRAPSGFVKPTLISEELASFLSKPHGTLMARTEVTREINAYIREHHLQDKDNGRKINADQKLSTLLSLSKEDELTYFNLQKYMSRHFAKAVKKEA
jgi:chromatin remodeling complex protein RSC6